MNINQHQIKIQKSQIIRERKIKLQCDIASYILEKLLPKNQKITSIDIEKGEPLSSVDRNVN